MVEVRLCYYDNVYLKIKAEPGLVREMAEAFTFDVPGAKFTPAYKRGWDGKIRLLNPLTCLIYTGLLNNIIDFCESRNLTHELDSEFDDVEFSTKNAVEFINALSPKYPPREYQIDAFIHGVNKKRALFLSPTGSGKSLLIYMLMRFYSMKTLIIVPTVSLVHQLCSDFEEYGLSEKYIHKISSGADRNTDKNFVISTWQSVYTLNPEWLKQFDVIIGDEAHGFKSKELVKIMSNAVNCKYRFGLTGTLDGSFTNELVLQGLFGKIYKTTTTSDLIEQKFLANLKISAILLQYSPSIRKALKGADYPTEINFLITCKKRNKFISNLALSLKGNTFLLYRNIDHGNEIYDTIKITMQKAGITDRNVYIVNGTIDGEEREKIRKLIETEKDAIVVASYGTSSTGINIRNLHNIIFASPSKSRVRNLQSIGRVLRTSENKEITTVYDIADDLSIKKSKNFTLLHFFERVKIYNEEKFDYKVFNEDLLFEI